MRQVEAETQFLKLLQRAEVLLISGSTEHLQQANGRVQPQAETKQIPLQYLLHQAETDISIAAR